MIDRTVNSLSPLVYMSLGIILAMLSVAASDRTTAGALLCAACASTALTGVKWGQREQATVDARD